MANGYCFEQYSSIVNTERKTQENIYSGVEFRHFQGNNYADLVLKSKTKDHKVHSVIPRT